jgi:hypothetical protein
MLSMAPLPLRVEKVTSNLHTAVLIISYFFQANTVTALFEAGHNTSIQMTKRFSSHSMLNNLST